MSKAAASTKDSRPECKLVLILHAFMLQKIIESIRNKNVQSADSKLRIVGNIYGRFKMNSLGSSNDFL